MPERFAHLDFRHFFLQPMDGPERERNTKLAIEYCRAHPQWRLSLQMHKHRSEHWVVLSGVAGVVNGDREFTINANESTYIPAGQKHRLHNPGDVPLVIIEVQTGDYVGEDDIVRFDDVYGRAPAPAKEKASTET